MGGWIRLSFHHKVFVALLSLCALLVGMFVIFQFQRERKFRRELLNTELQMLNSRILDELDRGGSAESAMHRMDDSPFDELRVTLIDRDGRVTYDNNDNTPFPTTNHNNRPEVMEARAHGTGYTVERWSESDETDYFYSARLGRDGTVVRSAVPYTHTLQVFLKADRTFLRILGLIAMAVSLAGYFVAKRLSYSISRLNVFADKAQRGERIFDDESFPDDELGNIAANIVRLYVERDAQHREALAQERDKIRLKKQLTNNINHELKTPVASIQLCSELLMDHPDLPADKRREFVERIHGSALRLGALLNDVSALTRMEDGSGRIEKECLDLSAIVHDIVAEERLRTDMEIKVEMPQELMIDGNRLLVESVFRNLIGNAIAYSGGTEIVVSGDGSGHFTVRDNGAGVAPEHLPHLFERFYRVDKGRSRAHGGTGLGLSIVRNAVALHGGKIRVVNDGGLRFDFNFDLFNKKITKS